MTDAGELTKDDLIEIDRLLSVARGAAQKIRAGLTRSGRTIYGAAEVDWLLNDVDKFMDARKWIKAVYDAAPPVSTTETAGEGVGL